LPKKARDKQLCIRMESELLEEIDKAQKAEGFASPSAWVRQACVNQLVGTSKALSETEARILSSLERQSRDIRKNQTATVAAYALLDTFIKLYLTYTPELLPETKTTSVAQAKVRYERFVKDVAKNLTGNAAASLKQLSDDLVNGS
jgi:hypothetical protein